MKLFYLLVALVTLAVFAAGIDSSCHQPAYHSLTGHAPRCDDLDWGAYGCGAGGFYNRDTHCCFKLQPYTSCGIGQNFDHARRCCEDILQHHHVAHHHVHYVPRPHYHHVHHHHHGCCRWGHRHCCRRRWSWFG